jgi:hypothetical protein
MSPLHVWVLLSVIGSVAAVILIAVTLVDLVRARRAGTNGDRLLAVHSHGLVATCALIGSGMGLWLVTEVIGDNPNYGGSWTRGVATFVVSNAAFTAISVVLVVYRLLLRRRVL